MNDTFTDETQLDIDSSFTDSPPAEEPSTDIVEILPNGDEPVITPPVEQITATPTPAMVTATPTPVPQFPQNNQKLLLPPRMRKLPWGIPPKLKQTIQLMISTPCCQSASRHWKNRSKNRKKQGQRKRKPLPNTVLI